MWEVHGERRYVKTEVRRSESGIYVEEGRRYVMGECERWSGGYRIRGQRHVTMKRKRLYVCQLQLMNIQNACTVFEIMFCITNSYR